MLYIKDCKATFYKYIKLNIMPVRGDVSRIYVLGSSFILIKCTGKYFFDLGKKTKGKKK